MTTCMGSKLGRRTFLRAAAVLSLAAPVRAQTAAPACQANPEADVAWFPPPAMGGTERMIQLPDVRLWCADTGGTGEPIVLLHPLTGSGACWGYQQSAFAAAGYRVITYSRRGHYRSEAGPSDRVGTAAGDLLELVNALGVGRFHLVGCALGGFGAVDFALAYPERLLSLVVASSLGGVSEPAFESATRALLPSNFYELPAEFRELGPAYRAAHPAGVAQWLAIKKDAVTDKPVWQRYISERSWAAIERISVPALLVSGDADQYMPAPRLREWASHLRHAKTVVLPECGHAPHWEQPRLFNAAVLELLQHHRTSARALNVNGLKD